MIGRSRDGVALMLSLWLIIVLAVIAAHVTHSSRTMSYGAANLRAEVTARYAAESGIVLAAAKFRKTMESMRSPGEASDYLNGLENSREPELQLGDARTAIAYVDVNARLDVNLASAAQLARLFAFFAAPAEATKAAMAIREWIGAEDVPAGLRSRSGFPRRDLRFPDTPAARPVRSLEELRRVPGISQTLLESAAPYLTVDGDGNINRAAASDTVMAAAAGNLVSQPSRILIVSRGWKIGHPLTYEIQAVYAVEGPSLTLVRWQERDL